MRKTRISKILLLFCLLGAFCATFVLPSCGAKKNVAKQSEKITLQGQEVLIAANSETDKPTLGLLWQNDLLQITLNQGRQLEYYRAETDTLYLYETSRDMTDFSTRRYTLNIPNRDLLIIKYNDSLVYPLMPTDESCEYPLDVKPMGRKIVDEYEYSERERQRIKEEQIKQGTYRATGVLNVSLIPFEFWEGTYLYNAGSYKLGSDCKCKTDSSEVLVLHVDGTWQRYENNMLKNCGIMRKGGNPDCYEMDNYNHETVLFLDTASIAGHVISLREDKRRWQENIPYQYNEYRWVGKGKVGLSFMFIKVYPQKTDNIILPYFWVRSSGYFMLEGSTCGWQQISRECVTYPTNN